jgi:hypothetical protein
MAFFSFQALLNANSLDSCRMLGGRRVLALELGIPAWRVKFRFLPKEQQLAGNLCRTGKVSHF